MFRLFVFVFLNAKLNDRLNARFFFSSVNEQNRLAFKLKIVKKKTGYLKLISFNLRLFCFYP